MPRSLKRLLLLLLASMPAAFAADCGSGTTSHPPPTPIDTTPPTVTARTPANGRTDVFVHEPIVATFSEKMLAGSINDASVAVTGTADTILAKSLALVGGTALQITFPTAPSVPNTISIDLKTGIKDLADNALVAPGSWTFRLPTWLTFGGPPSNAGQIPWVTLDHADRPRVGWKASDGWHVAGLSGPGGALTAEGGALTVYSSHNIYGGAITVDTKDRTIAMWAELNPGNNHVDVHVSRWDGTSWTALGNSLGTSLLSFNLDVAADPSDRPIIAWPENGIQVQRWDGSAWASLGPITGTAGLSLEPSVKVQSDGTPVVAFSDNNSFPSVVRVEKWVSSSWMVVGTGAITAFTGGDAFAPSLVLDTAERPVIAFSENDGSVTNVMVMRFDGAKWVQVGGPLSAVAGNTFVYDPRVGIDGLGQIWVSWYEDDSSGGSTESVYFRRWTGSTWDAPEGGVLDANGAGTTAYFPGLAVDSFGSPVFTWQEADGAGGTDVEVWRLNR